MNTFLLAAVAIGLMAFLIISRRRRAAAGDAPAKERSPRSRSRSRGKSKGGAIKGYPEPAAAAAETAASRTLSPVLEPLPAAAVDPVAPPVPPPPMAGGIGDLGFDEMIVEPGWPMPGEMAGTWPADSPLANAPLAPAPPVEPAPAPASEPAVAEADDATTGEWTMTATEPYDEPEPEAFAPEPVAEAAYASDGEAEPAMEAWVPGVSEVDPVVLLEPEPLPDPEPEPEPFAAPAPEPELVWADPAPAAEPDPVAVADPAVEPDPVAGPPAWEPAPEPEAEPVLAVLPAWEPEPEQEPYAGEPVLPAEDEPWVPAAVEAEPAPEADVDAHLDALAEGLPLAVAAVSPLLSASDHAGVTPRMGVVLRALADDPRGLPDLGRALGVSRPVVADVCARLEALGLVQRLRDPADRRRLLMVPTDEGLRLAEETEPRVDRDAVAGALGRLSAAELGALVSAVRTLQEASAR